MRIDEISSIRSPFSWLLLEVFYQSVTRAEFLLFIIIPRPCISASVGWIIRKWLIMTVSSPIMFTSSWKSGWWRREGIGRRRGRRKRRLWGQELTNCSPHRCLAFRLLIFKYDFVVVFIGIFAAVQRRRFKFGCDVQFRTFRSFYSFLRIKYHTSNRV